ncbi:hypothetical protein M758_1G002700 [Ceratodon purpureus]|nr:hypothetical protein M758_1G002700 [Ceratodon purpureus]
MRTRFWMRVLRSRSLEILLLWAPASALRPPWPSHSQTNPIFLKYVRSLVQRIETPNF